MRRYFSNINFTIGFCIISFFILLMLLSFIWTPQDPYQINETLRVQAPSATHWLGTDYLGRDLLSRIMIASQSAFLVGSLTVLISVVIGVFLGCISGYYGGIVDEVLMRLTDAFMAIPGILLLLMFITIFGKGTFNTIIAIAVLSIPSLTRLTRGRVIEIKSRDYIVWARSVGVSNFRILFVHILPNIVSTIIVAATLKFSNVILLEASLSYLGLGVQLPHPSWGMILARSKDYILTNPYYAIIPGILITLVVIGFNQLGDGLKEIFQGKGH